MSHLLDLALVDRETALRTWLCYHKISIKDLTITAKVSASTITRIVSGERAPREAIERLVNSGVPRDLLPTPGRGPGRPPSVRS